MTENESLELFGAVKEPDNEIGWKLYQKSVDFKTAVNLYDTVKVNENFFVGKQWEGVESNGLPTPTFNIIKRVVSFITATITSDNIKVTASSMVHSLNPQESQDIVDIVNDELRFLFEYNRIPALIRKFARNAAVDGDACIYTYWDPDIETGQTAKGGIKSEIISNLRVHFGNPNDSDVQSQPWIIIEKREQVRKAKRRAKANGIENWDEIMPDEGHAGVDDVKRTDDKVTVLLVLWRDEDDGVIHAFECTKQAAIKKPWSLGIKMYPITWLSWEEVQDSYHGQGMVTGLIPNQVFINKAWAMTMLSIMRTAFPKYLFNKTVLQSLDNRIGGAIGYQGGDINNVIKVVDPAVISPQVSQLIELAISETESSLGATSVALGDTRPDNTSAIIALQRAAATPSEMTKQNLYDATEELSRIYFEFMAEYYGIRNVLLPLPAETMKAMEGTGVLIPDKVVLPFDFNALKNHPMFLKVDVGASTYYSEIASTTTMENLLRLEKIDIVQFLERISDDYVPRRRDLIEEKKREKEEQRQMMLMQAGIAPEQAGTPEEPEATPEIPQGGGYSALQRKINETGTTAGIV